MLLREVFLPPFAHGVAAGSPTVMVNSGDVNGIPGHANGHYLNDILKGELGFKGFVVSDWEVILKTKLIKQHFSYQLINVGKVLKIKNYHELN